MQTDPDKLASGNRGLAHTKDEMNKEDPTQGIPDWLQPFTENLEDLETHVPAHSSEREISDSEGDAGSTVSIKVAIMKFGSTSVIVNARLVNRVSREDKHRRPILP